MQKVYSKANVLLCKSFIQILLKLTFLACLVIQLLVKSVKVSSYQLLQLEMRLLIYIFKFLLDLNQGIIFISLHYKYYLFLSTLFHVFELARPLPIFSMYMLIDNSSDREPKGFVTFYINERVPRVNHLLFFYILIICFSGKKVLVWINHHFLLSQEYAPNTPNLHVTFLAVRNDAKLIIKMQNNGQVSWFLLHSFFEFVIYLR